MNSIQSKYKHYNVEYKEMKGKNCLILDKEIDKWGWENKVWGTSEQWKKKERFPYPKNESIRLYRYSSKMKKFIPYYVFNIDETIEIKKIDILFKDVKPKK